MGLIGDSSLILKETVVLPMLSEFGDSLFLSNGLGLPAWPSRQRSLAVY